MVLRLLIAVLLLLAAPARAEEAITAFDADIVLEADGDLIVTETITVRTENVQIKRGIYRDLPLLTKDGDGESQAVDFEILSVTRGGQPEPFFTERNGISNLRIYIGDRNVFLSPGRYTYVLTYRAPNQTRHFDTHTEVYWNATGNDWIFPIERATARVTLPEGGEIEDVAVFTGLLGSTASNGSAERVNDRRARFATTRLLARREGMSVAVKFQRGLVPVPPSNPFYSTIERFESDAVLNTDGSLDVTERVRINVTKTDPVRYGLFRSFNTPGTDRDDRPPDISDFSVTRNGAALSARYQTLGRNGSLYLGDYGDRVPAGQHEYVLRYRWNRAVEYGGEGDTLTWHGLPRGFDDMAVAEASGRLTLPSAAEGLVAATLLQDGPRGALEPTDLVEMTTTDNGVSYRTTERIAGGKTLHLSLAMPKGIVNAPDMAQRLAWFWADNFALLVGYIMLVVVGLYWLIVWLFVGRDPRPGTVVPRWEPPEGVSPALVSYIEERGLRRAGRDAMAAALVSLGVKGLLTMKGFDDTLSITTEKVPMSDLPVGEAALYKALPAGELKFNRSNASKVSKLTSAFKKAMTDEHRNTYFRKNIGWLIGGLILSAGAIAGYMGMDANTTSAVAENVFPFVIVGGAALLFLFILLRILRDSLTSKDLGGKLFLIVLIPMMLFMGATIFSVFSELFMDGVFDFDLPVLMPVLGILGLAVLFWFLIGAPTSVGREVMDRIEGLRLYLNMAEKDRLNMAGAPAMTPQHFETLLPYAMALGVEKPWSESFQTWLEQATPADQPSRRYQPHWNRDWRRSFSPGLGLSTGVASGFASAVPASSSSSSGGFSGGSSGFSGGGGFSSGGGGGGGGGGW